MRIAFVSLMEAGPWGGSEVLWHTAAMHALEQGDQVFVSVFKWDKVHDQIKLLQEKGATIYFKKRRHDKHSIFEKVIRYIKVRKPSLNRDYQSIIKFKPETVFISQGENFDLAWDHKHLYALLMRHNIPYALICHSHIQYSWLPPKEIYPGAVEMFKNAKHVFFVSKRQWQLTERRLASKLDNGQIIWNPVNLDLPQNALPWKEDEVVQMAVVGSFLDNKGQDTALEVFSELQWKQRTWRLNFYGDGEGEKYLKDLAVYYGIEDKVIFHGHVKDIKQIWKDNHILLIPSSREGLPISLVEAMACARPTIATDVGGITELITENETGFIAASPTTGSFSEAMERGWLKRNDWKEMGLKSFQLINMKFERRPEVKLYKALTTRN